MRDYRYKSLAEPALSGSGRSSWISRRNFIKAWIVLATLLIVYLLYIMIAAKGVALALTGGAIAAVSPVSGQSTGKVPDYFQTSPELYAGPTATGRAPFLAETNPVSFAPTVTFVPNAPLETAEPIIGATQNQSIFQLMGNLSPYTPNSYGFGVHEYPLPAGANISQVQVSRPNRDLQGCPKIND
jgi:hypothetical protein